MITGTASLPLHSGKAPGWLMKRMKGLANEMTKLIVDYKGEKYFFQLISNPYWFQSFGCVLGFDWHSSGLTTTTIAALKSINNDELDIKIAGGKGKAHKVQNEIENLADKMNLNEHKLSALKYYSKMSAKVDNVLVQDDFNLYHHSIIFSKKYWAVIQQGKNNSWARRYHWLSDNVQKITIEPHSGIQSEKVKQKVLNMTSKDNKEHQKISVDLVNDNPEHVFKYFSKQRTLNEFTSKSYNQDLKMPKNHYIEYFKLSKQAREALKKAYEIKPKDYEELIAIKGLGKSSIRALALVSELVYGKELSWKDPAKYSYAHGGKDGTPFPVKRRTYDKTIEFLKETIKELSLNKNEKKQALMRLAKVLEVKSHAE
ncbi:MAG: uncharacterized protein PWP03_14 [Candidatus Woesearchaeota archaeon]|nr:uncharacterized protein [Candidatus Woesearchaeota archaeon]MDN5327376.1 uncharacterized protein [Candidatus Woesearchaeota archaeon]